MKAHAFNINPETVYLCGHSLGPMPESAQSAVNELLMTWGTLGVRGWSDAHWLEKPTRIAETIAGLIGTTGECVLVGESTSVNLYKVLMSALALSPERTVMLSTNGNFPTDNYIAQGICRFNPAIALRCVPESELLSQLSEAVSVVFLTHVNYRDASVLDMETIIKQAHARGILVVCDLSHSVGVMPLALDAMGVDFAVGCTYKYLNGGPGSPAFLYVNARHHKLARNPITGWMGHRDPFAFTTIYEPSHGVSHFQTGTPFMLGLAALEGALRVFDGMDMPELYGVTRHLREYLVAGLTRIGLHCLPVNSALVGGHVAVIDPHGYALSQALITSGVVCDYRDPGLIRFCVSGLYLDKTHIDEALNRIADVVLSGQYRKLSSQRKQEVT